MNYKMNEKYLFIKKLINVNMSHKDIRNEFHGKYLLFHAIIVIIELINSTSKHHLQVSLLSVKMITL